MTQSVYSFERTELRVLQNVCAGDNEKFLNAIADMVGRLTEERDNARQQLALAEHEVRCCELGICSH